MDFLAAFLARAENSGALSHVHRALRVHVRHVLRALPHVLLLIAGGFARLRIEFGQRPFFLHLRALFLAFICKST